MPTFNIETKVLITFSTGVKGEGIAFGALDYTLGDDGSLTLNSQSLVGGLRRVRFEEGEPGPVVSGLSKLEFPDLNVSVEAPVAVNRQADGHYTGTFRLAALPQALRDQYEQRPVVSASRATGDAVATPPTNGATSERSPAQAVSPAGLEAATEVSELNSASVVAAGLVEAVQHTDAIKAIIKEYIQTEPSPFAQAVLRALQVEVDTISGQIDKLLSSPETADQAAVRGAALHIRWFIQAVRGVNEVVSLVQRLQDLLGVLGL